MLQCPGTKEEWQKVADEFLQKWQFPNCLGAIDGKHVQIRPPPNSGSIFYNYKHTFSIVMMAVVDADYKFLFVDVGRNGRVSDGGVFAATDLYKVLEDKQLNIPEPRPFPHDDTPMPYCFVGDEAFPLRSYLMKPFPFRNLSSGPRIFNYRLSRARRVVENAFGILANRFRVLLQPMLIRPERAEKVVMATCALHNFLRVKSPTTSQHLMDIEDENTHELQPGLRQTDATLEDVAAMRGNNATKAAKGQRDYICKYFNSPVGSVSWQDNMV